MSRFTHKPRRTTAPVRLIVVSFVLLIALGTLLLSLPVSSATGDFTNPVSALFTATSATCVTGLAVEDTTAHWSVFGQVVLLLLIQLGGWGFPPLPRVFRFWCTGGWASGRWCLPERPRGETCPARLGFCG